MKTVSMKVPFLLAAAILTLIAAVSTNVFAQGRGAGRGAGAGREARPVGGATGSVRDITVMPGGRRDFPVREFPTRRAPEIDRTRRVDHERRERERRDEDTRRETRRRHDDEANRFQKLARWLDVSPERLQNFYQQAKSVNPDLRPSEFFAALVISHRLNGSNPNVTPQAILRGLNSGMSLERTLVNLGLTPEEATDAVKWAQRIFNHLKP